MPAPTNTTAGTALVVSALPYSNTQTVDDAGTTYTVWYKYVSTFDGVLGVFGLGDLTTYKPGYYVASPDDVTDYQGFFANSDATFRNRPFLMPVQTGVTYYVSFIPNSGNPSPASLTVTMEAFAAGDPIQAGDFITNREVDNDYEQPVTVLSSEDDYTVRTFVQMADPEPGARTSTGLPHGHYGVITSDGHVIWQDEQYGDIKIYDSSLTEVAAISSYPVGVLGPGASRSTWFIAYLPSPFTDFHVDELDTEGNVLDTWVLTGITSIKAFSVNDDNTILYFTVQAASSKLRAWDLVGGAILPDLDTVASSNTEDVLVMADGSIVAVYYTNGSAPTTVTAKQYQPDGTVLNTYTFGGALYRNSFNPPRIGYSTDPLNFWITLKLDSNFAISSFQQILLSDGSVVSTVNHANYLFGQYISQTATTTPLSRFGPEKSFALLQMPVSESTTATLTVTKVVSPDTDPTEFDFTAGGGLSPSTFSLGHGDSQVFSSLAPGTYSIAELAVAGWVQALTVSNGDDASAITLAAGDDVTVSVVNSTTIYPPDEDFDEEPVVRERITPHVNQERQRVTISKVQLDCEVGVGLANGQGIDPLIEFQISRDGGHTWGPIKVGHVGKMGEYQRRVIWRQCGQARDWVFRWRQSDPVKTAWIAVYIDATQDQS